MAHAISASYSKSVIIPYSISLHPHVKAGDQDSHVPVPGVLNVILWVEAVAVLTEGLEDAFHVTFMAIKLFRFLYFCKKHNVAFRF